MGALWKFGTPLAPASGSLIPPKAPVLGLYPTNEGDGCGREMDVGSIIKWGTHYLGFVLGGGVGYLLLLCWVLFN